MRIIIYKDKSFAVVAVIQKNTLKMEYTTKQDDFQPFQVLWLDSCYQQTLLPEAPWHKVRQWLPTVCMQILCNI